MDERTVPATPGAKTEDAHPLLLGARWRAIALLGSGGMGSVYLAHDSELGELVAIKVVRSEVALQPGMIERFREEVRLSRRVSSPHVARTHDLGEHDGRLFLTMQYLEGEALSARIKRDGPLDLADVVAIARDVCAGLDAVHEAGVVHRDLKPGNVLLAKDGRAVITDFGVALRASQSGRSDGSGTPTYAAPEQLLGRAVDARADVYSLGALLYAAVTGKKPFAGPRTGAEAPPDPRALRAGVPEALATVIMTAMALDPDARYASAGALWDALAPLASIGARSEGRLFAFVRSICRSARLLRVELACEGATPALRDAVRHHLASRLAESGEIRVVEAAPEADATLEGAVVLEGATASLRLALASRDGDEFWRARFDGSAASLPTLAERAAAEIARALAASARPAEETGHFATREAAELYLDARVEYRRFYPANIERAIDLLDRALALSPDNPNVLACKAAALTRLRFFVPGPDRAHDLIERARALGSREALPWVASAETCLQDMRVVEAARSWVTALRLAPGLGDARETFASFLMELGAFEPAIRLAESLRAGGSLRGRDVAMRVAAMRGQFAEVYAIAEETHQAGDMRTMVGALRYAMWNHDRDAFRRFWDLTGAPGIDAVTHRLRTVLRGAVLDGALEASQLELLGPSLTPRRRAVGYQMAAETAAYLRRDALFFECLDRTVAAGVFDGPWIDRCQLLDPYRGSVHFETARRTIHRRAYDALVEIDRCLEG